MSVRELGWVGKFLFMAFVVFSCTRLVTAQATMTIGQVQGRGSESEYFDRIVTIRGIVSGILEDENSRGTRFYTVYIQDLPGTEDGDSLTSDGMAIFVGARRPNLAIGDIIRVSGRVTEFYGLTELDNNDLYINIESRNNILPQPVEIDPPADNAESATYLERFESMRVSLPASTVVGPAHTGCGFSVVRRDTGLERVIVTKADDPVGHIVGVLHRSDVDCDVMPDVAQGDEVVGLVGPLTYHFDRFKIVYQDTAELLVLQRQDRRTAEQPATLPGSVVIATFNVNDYFDTEDDTGQDAEPKLSKLELTLKTSKVAATISEGLGCPELLGLQEVENEAVLQRLVTILAEPCGFEYEFSHLDSPDARGAEQAILSDPRRVQVGRVSLRQVCSDLDTGVVDPEAACQADQLPLFSRPPLQVEGVVDGRGLVILANHFKSKRDGAAETAPRRLEQARRLSQIVEQIQASNPGRYLIVLGDFNDYHGSEVMETMLAGSHLVDALAELPADQRYSYIFDGASQLIDWLLVSPALKDFIVQASILHTNADYSYRLGESGDRVNLSFRSSDHDVPYFVLDFDSEKALNTASSVVSPTGAPNPTAKIVAEPSPTNAPAITPFGAVRTEAQPADDSSSPKDNPAVSQTVVSQSAATLHAEGSGYIAVGILVLAAATAIAGAIAIRNRS